MKTFLAIVAVLFGLLGVAWLLLPRFMLNVLGAPETDPITVYMARRYGALFLGYAVIAWLGRVSSAPPARAPILAGGAVVVGVLAILSLVGAASEIVGPAIWGVVVAEVLLAAGFIYFYSMARPSAGRPEEPSGDVSVGIERS
jgi:hypothetical protein